MSTFVREMSTAKLPTTTIFAAMSTAKLLTATIFAAMSTPEAEMSTAKHFCAAENVLNLR